MPSPDATPASDGDVGLGEALAAYRDKWPRLGVLFFLSVTDEQFAAITDVLDAGATYADALRDALAAAEGRIACICNKGQSMDGPDEWCPDPGHGRGDQWPAEVERLRTLLHDTEADRDAKQRVLDAVVARCETQGSLDASLDAVGIKPTRMQQDVVRMIATICNAERAAILAIVKGEA